MSWTWKDRSRGVKANEPPRMYIRRDAEIAIQRRHACRLNALMIPDTSYSTTPNLNFLHDPTGNPTPTHNAGSSTE